MMFYTTVCGWMLIYFFKFATGQLSGLDPAGVGEAFGSLLGDPKLLCGAMALVVATGFLILSIGLRSGLERVSKAMMLLLLAMMVVLAVNSCFLRGGAEGVAFYLKPDWDHFVHAAGGPGRVCVNAMNQAFFTLSLGIGAMAIFGSYIGKDRSLLGESIHVTLLDTFVALVAGLIIFPACFAYNGGETGAGPGLIFVTLPNVFNAMPAGRLWGTLFFVFMTFAAFSTVLAVFENILAMTMDGTGLSRPKACALCCGLLFVLSLPCALGFNVLSGLHPLGPGSGVLDLEDFLVSNLALPIGSLLFAVFCTRRYGWGWESFVAEANAGTGLKVPTSGRFQALLRAYLGYLLPLLIAFVMLVGLVDKYKEIKGNIDAAREARESAVPTSAKTGD
jgi:NSS family neurotransmitter:Na+ symporter